MVDSINANLNEMFVYLTGNEYYKRSKLIKVHTKNLTKGEYSFPNSIESWKPYVKCNQSKLQKFNDNSQENEQNFVEELIRESQNWTFKVNSMKLIEDHWFIHLKRDLAFKLGIEDVLKYRESYGYISHKTTKCVHVSSIQNVEDATLTDLRLNIATDICKVFLPNLGYTISDSYDEAEIHLCFVKNNNNKHTNNFAKLIHCGTAMVVGKPNTKVSGHEFQEKRTNQMQLLAQHKYGIRFTDNSKTKLLCQQLGDYSVKFEMLQVKLSKPMSINLENITSCSSKGVSFILYNYARISSMREEFKRKIESNYYPELPNFECIDCTLYKDDLEWELLFCYILRFPWIIKECSDDILNGVFNPHYLCNFLSGLVGVFSVYYRNVKILVTSHEHIVPVIHARIYLLTALDYVLANGLTLLSIKPLKKM